MRGLKGRLGVFSLFILVSCSGANTTLSASGSQGRVVNIADLAAAYSKVSKMPEFSSVLHAVGGFRWNVLKSASVANAGSTNSLSIEGVNVGNINAWSETSGAAFDDMGQRFSTVADYWSEIGFDPTKEISLSEFRDGISELNAIYSSTGSTKTQSNSKAAKTSDKAAETTATSKSLTEARAAAKRLAQAMVFALAGTIVEAYVPPPSNGLNLLFGSGRFCFLICRNPAPVGGVSPNGGSSGGGGGGSSGTQYWIGPTGGAGGTTISATDPGVVNALSTASSNDWIIAINGGQQTIISAPGASGGSGNAGAGQIQQGQGGQSMGGSGATGRNFR